MEGSNCCRRHHRFVTSFELLVGMITGTLKLMMKYYKRFALAVLVFLTLMSGANVKAQVPGSWSSEWPNTDFSNSAVEFNEILSGGPPKDGIPAIDKPKFAGFTDARVQDMAPTEPVIGLIMNGKARAYPLHVLTWHEIVNDELAGIPITVTYCPLCNSSIVFDRRLDGRVLDFGTTGKLRNSDMVMYDRQTETWWQQFLGEGIVGELTGKRLNMIPSRLESFASFKKRAPDGQVLIPSDPDMRRYGQNPYTGYDSAPSPFLYRGELPDYINPMVRVVVVEDKAWAWPLLVEKGSIKDGDLEITWNKGQNSALDTRSIRKGRDVGNITVQKSGKDVVHDVTFAFVYHVFHGGKRIIVK